MASNMELNGITSDFFFEFYYQNSDPFIVINETGRIRSANPAACSYSGYSSAELTNFNLTEIISSKTQVNLFQYLSDTERVSECSLIRKDGTEAHAVLYKDWVKMAGSEYGLVRLLPIDKDCEARDHQQAREFVDVILNALADPVFVKNESHQWVLLNDAACRIIGGTRETLIGKSDYDMFPRHEADVFWNIDDEVFRKGGVNVNEEHITTDGITRVISTKKSIFMDPFTGKKYLVGLIRDITDKYYAEKALEHAKNEAESANEKLRIAAERAEHLARKAGAAAAAKSEFLANMSHEIRTPLNGVLGMTELMMDTSMTDQQLEYMETIRTSAKSLLQILNDILDFSKIEAGKYNLETVEFDLENVIQKVSNLLIPRIKSKKLDYTVSTDPEIPELLLGDPMRIRQILTNLLDNAVKFTSKGSIGLLVQCTELENKTVSLRFEVTDTGIGIQPSLIGELFQPFSQLDSSTTRSHSGTGLGLSICKRLVEMMGGKIGVSVNKGFGATFWFTLKLKQVSKCKNNGIEADHETERVTSKDSELQLNGHMLLAEDNTINRKVAVKILENIGLTVDAVTNGREALRLATQNNYDVIIMDIQMPEVDGYEATRRIRAIEQENGRYTPIIAMTAHAFESDRIKCLQSGMDAYIAKPVEIAIIRQILTDVKRKKRG